MVEIGHGCSISREVTLALQKPETADGVTKGRSQRGILTVVLSDMPAHIQDQADSEQHAGTRQDNIGSRIVQLTHTEWPNCTVNLHSG